MTQTPLEQARGLQIGTVEFVSPNEIRVSIDIEAPEYIALNTGSPQSFPRVNSYVLITVDDGFLVGQIEWLTVEQSAFPKRRGMQDFGLIDLPYPMRRLSLNPIGTLCKSARASEKYVFRRGSDALPSVGAAVMLPTDYQLRSIVESGERGRVKIGTSPLAGNAEVRIDPDRLFGRHLAILGNTGSGKSCSVAGLIRWCLEEAQEIRSPQPDGTQSTVPPNARFIILDPNGEYSRAFGADQSVVKARIFKVNSVDGDSSLKVPLWFWNSAEWSSFAQASAKTQRPLLKRALREVKAGRTNTIESKIEEKKLNLRRYLSSRLVSIRSYLVSGAIQQEETKFGFRLRAIATDIESKRHEFPDHLLDDIKKAIDEALESTFRSFIDRSTGDKVEYYNAFTEKQVTAIIESFSRSLDTLGGIIYQEGPERLSENSIFSI